MTELTEQQLTALRNLDRKRAGESVDFINIADARALTEAGFALRQASGWRISDRGMALLQSLTPSPPAVSAGATPFRLSRPPTEGPSE